MKLNDLVPNLGTATGWTGWKKTDIIKVLTTGGSVDFVAKYYTWDALTDTQRRNFFSDDPTKFTNGWYRCQNNATSTLTAKYEGETRLPFGTCVLAYTAQSAATIQSAGEVFTSDDGYITFDLVAGNTRYVGNCTPKDLTLGDFVPNLGTDLNWTGWKKTDIAKVLTTGGSVDFTAKYYTWDALTDTQRRNFFSDDPTKFTNGWYKCQNNATSTLTAEYVSKTPITAGNGFLVYTAQSTATIKIPTAL